MSLTPSTRHPLLRRVCLLVVVISALGEFAFVSRGPAGEVEIADDAPQEASERRTCRQCDGTREVPCPDCDATGKQPRPCPLCEGTGKLACPYECEGGLRVCRTCSGRGFSVRRYIGIGGGGGLRRIPCGECDQTGRRPCKRCDRGFVECTKCSGDRKILERCERCQGRRLIDCTRCRGVGSVEAESLDQEVEDDLVHVRQRANGLSEGLSALAARLEGTLAAARDYEAEHARLEARMEGVDSRGVDELADRSAARDEPPGVRERLRDLDIVHHDLQTAWGRYLRKRETFARRQKSLLDLEGPTRESVDRVETIVGEIGEILEKPDTAVEKNVAERADVLLDALRPRQTFLRRAGEQLDVVESDLARLTSDLEALAGPLDEFDSSFSAYEEAREAAKTAAPATAPAGKAAPESLETALPRLAEDAGLGLIELGLRTETDTDGKARARLRYLDGSATVHAELEETHRVDERRLARVPALVTAMFAHDESLTRIELEVQKRMLERGGRVDLRTVQAFTFDRRRWSELLARSDGTGGSTRWQSLLAGSSPIPPYPPSDEPRQGGIGSMAWSLALILAVTVAALVSGALAVRRRGPVVE